MRAVPWTILAILCFQLPSAAQEPHRPRHPWLRRLTMAGACAASLWDLQTTRVAIGHGAAREANPLFSDPQGHPRWGRIIGFKAGTCVASFAVEERFARRSNSDTFWTAVNGLSAGAFAAIAIHNLKVAAESSPPRYVFNLTVRTPWATIRPDAGQLPQDRWGARK